MSHSNDWVIGRDEPDRPSDHEKSLLRGFRIYLGGMLILLIGSLGMVWALIYAHGLSQ